MLLTSSLISENLGKTKELSWAEKYSLIISKSFLANTIFILAFFPFSKLIPVIPAKIQPLGAVISFLFLLSFHPMQELINTRTIFYLYLTSCYFFIGLITQGTTASFLTFVSYTAPVFIFLALKDSLSLVNFKLIKYVIYINIMMGLFQWSGYYQYISKYVKLIIPINSRAAAIASYRGLAFAAPEPSNSAFIIILLLVVSYYYYFFNKKKLRIYTLVLLIMALLNKSGTMFLFLFVFFCSLFFYHVFFNRQLMRKIK